MTFWVAGAVVGSSLIGANAASSAASTQAESANRAADLQYKMWQEQQALQEPWRKAGVNALGRLETGLAQGGEFATPFSKTNWQQDPGYQFRLSEGLKALDRTAAARGGLVSGGALKAAERYGQDLGSQEYQNAFNRYYQERANMLNPVQSLAGVGQTATQQLGQAAGQYGTNVGNLMTQAGAAQAAGTVGGANALTGGLSTYLNYNQGQNLLNALQYGRNAGLVNQYGAGNVYLPGGGSGTSWNTLMSNYTGEV